MNFVLKWITVIAVLAAGLFFLAHGLGVHIPKVEYKGPKAYDVPVGLFIVAAGIALAAFWKVETSTRTTVTNKFGSIVIEKVTKMFRGPGS